MLDVQKISRMTHLKMQQTESANKHAGRYKKQHSCRVEDDRTWNVNELNFKTLIVQHANWAILRDPTTQNKVFCINIWTSSQCFEAFLYI